MNGVDYQTWNVVPPAGVSVRQVVTLALIAALFVLGVWLRQR